MDIRAKIDEITDKVKNDPAVQEKFKSDPVAAIEELAGVSIPREQVDQVVEAVKSKVALDKLGGALGGLFGKK